MPCQYWIQNIVLTQKHKNEVTGYVFTIIRENTKLLTSLHSLEYPFLHNILQSCIHSCTNKIFNVWTPVGHQLRSNNQYTT